MDTTRTKEHSIFHKVRNLSRNGLLLYSLRNYMTRFGIDIDPYYWLRHGMDLADEPLIRGNDGHYQLVQLSEDDDLEFDNIMGLKPVHLKKNISKGQLCLALKANGEIAAIIFAEFKDFDYKHRTFKMGNTAAYLLNLYTFESHRGRNLATNLRYHCYRTLAERGITDVYSITSYFNSASRKSNRKLNIRHETLFLHIGLFKRFHWNFTLKKF